MSESTREDDDMADGVCAAAAAKGLGTCPLRRVGRPVSLLEKGDAMETKWMLSLTELSCSGNCGSVCG